MYCFHYSNLEFHCGEFVGKYSPEKQNQWALKGQIDIGNWLMEL